MNILNPQYDPEGQGSSSGGERNDRNVSWNGRVRFYIGDDVKDIKEALDDQATRIGGK